MRALPDLAWMRRFDSIARPAWIRATYAAAWASFLSAPDFSIAMEGFDPRALRGPLLLATNHTHKLDWLPLRFCLFRDAKREVGSWIKLRGFVEDRLQGHFLARTGNIPLSSRGYVIAADLRAALGRAPSPAEYRALRAHLDEGLALPDEPWAELALGAPRSILGRPFDPGREAYAEAIEATFAAMMRETMRLARRAQGAGQLMHIYPEGTISARLGAGKRGAIQIALAMGLSILPVGVSGMRRSFPGARPRPGARVTLRFGRPWRPRPEAYQGFEPFVARSERAHAAQLDADTARIMDALNELVDPELRRAPGQGAPPRGEGVDRFVP